MMEQTQREAPDSLDEAACRKYMIDGDYDVFVQWFATAERGETFESTINKTHESGAGHDEVVYDMTLFDAAVSNDDSRLVKDLVTTPGCDWLRCLHSMFMNILIYHQTANPSTMTWLFRLTFGAFNALIANETPEEQRRLRQYLASNLPGVQVEDGGGRFAQAVDLQRTLLYNGTNNEADMIATLDECVFHDTFAEIIFDNTCLDPLNYKGRACMSNFFGMLGNENAAHLMKTYLDEYRRSGRCDFTTPGTPGALVIAQRCSVESLLLVIADFHRLFI